MKVYICMDMEGISNVVTSYQLMPNGSSPSVQEIREIATREVNAAVEGAFEGGATEVLVNENHSGGEIIPELLDHRAYLFAGKPKRLMTAEALEDYDVQFLIGLHARMGSADGVLDHTWCPKTIANFYVNGKPTGEIGLNALYAAEFGIPTALVTGCEAACAEAKNLLGNIETVIVKKGYGRFAAICPHPEVNRKRIRAAAANALRNIEQIIPLTMKKPMRLEFDFFTSQQALMCTLIQGCERVSDRTVRFQVPNFKEGIRVYMLTAIVHNAGTDPVY